MVQRVEITDFDSAKAWLETQAHQTRVWFGARCALRTLPKLGTWNDATTSGLAFASLRATLIAAAAATCPAAEIKKLEEAANSAANSAAFSSTASAASVAQSAAFSAAESAFSAADSAAYSADSAAYSAAESAALSALSAASRDANKILNWDPLWGDIDQPSEVAQAWQDLKTQWDADAADWSFWIEWYEGILKGDPLPWELTHRIALEVTKAQWDAGQTVVAERIAEIRAAWLIEALPQVDDIYETETGLYEVRGIPSEPTKLLNSVLDRVDFALDTAIQSNACDLNSMSLAAKLLRRALEIGVEDVNAVETYLRQASDLIKSGIEEGKYGQNDELQILCLTLDETALQLRADHPDVADAFDSRLNRRLREISDEKRLVIAQSIDALREGTGPRLNTELGLAAEVTQDGSSDTATSEAVKKSANWGAKITLAERAKQVEGSGWMSMGKIGLRAQSVWEIVSRLISGGG